MPKVSVIIPTYNREKYIGEAVNSVLSQTYTNWELIVVDDGSTDNTRKMVENFGEKVSYIYQENAGVQTARNKGFSVSKGEYILFLDSDDVLLPHNLECLTEVLEKNIDVDVSYGWYFWTNQENKPVINNYSPVAQYSYSPEDSAWKDIMPPLDGGLIEGEIFPDILKTETTLMMGSTLIRRECFEKVNGFNPDVKYMEHWDFFIRIAESSFIFSCVRRPVLKIRLHQDNRGNDFDKMLSYGKELLDHYESKSGEKRISQKFYSEACFELYFEIAGNYFQVKNVNKGVENINKAFQYKTNIDIQKHRYSKKISDMLITIALENSPDDPVKYLRKILALLDQNSSSKTLQQIILNDIYQMLFWENRKDRPVVRKYGLLSLRNDLRLVRDRGFLKTFLFSILPVRMISFLNQLSYPIDPNFLNRASKKRCIFISPHFDDAVLSCGGLMSKLSEKNTQLLSITVFTGEPSEKETLSTVAKSFHDAWDSGENPYTIRKKEEKKVLDKLNSSYKWLEKLDVIYRFADVKIKDGILNPGVSPEEDPVFSEIFAEILEIVKESPDCYIFAPLGIGNHPDHLVVNLAMRSIKNLYPELNLFFYEDFPYAITGDLKKKLAEYEYKPKSKNIDIHDSLQNRVELIKIYESQLDNVFEGAKNIEEIIRDYTERVGVQNRPQERYWYYS